MSRRIAVATTAIALVASLALSGCGAGDEDASTGPGPSPQTSDAASTLVVRTVDWNPTAADVGVIDAVTDLGDTTVLFGAHGATLIRGGAVQATIAGPTSWRTAAAIPAADGTGTWAIGVSADGKVLRVRTSPASLEDVSDRWALGDAKVVSVALLEEKTVAFGYAGGVAISDGTQVTRFDGPATGEIAGGGGKLAFVDAKDGTVHLASLSSLPALKQVSFQIPRAASVAVGADGLVVTSPDGLWVQSDKGMTSKASGAFGALAAAGERTWGRSGAELVLVHAGNVATSQGAKLPEGARLVGAPNGDVWVLDGGGARRLSGAAQSEVVADWEATMKPIYARVCATCHGPGGSAGKDLSTYAGWLAAKSAIQQRVVTDRSMPPSASALPDADRAAVAAWLGRN